MEVLVKNLTSMPLRRATLKRVAKRALELECGDSNAELSIVLVDDGSIAELNKRYRGIEEPTDVLAFPQITQENDAKGEDSEEVRILGDVVISLQTADRQARENGWPLEQEVALLLIHGILHLLNYDHQSKADSKRMREKEAAILVELGFKP